MQILYLRAPLRRSINIGKGSGSAAKNEDIETMLCFWQLPGASNYDHPSRFGLCNHRHGSSRKSISVGLNPQVFYAG